MIDVNKLDKVNDLHIYLTSKFIIERKYLETLEQYENFKDEIDTHDLKDQEEATGTLILISIDPKDPTTGYCLMDIGGKLTNVMIYDPKKVFKRWDKDKGIVFSEKVSVVRLDKDGIPGFYLRYHSDTFKIGSKEITKYVTDYINGMPSKEEKKARESEPPPDKSKYPELKHPLPEDDL